MKREACMSSWVIVEFEPAPRALQVMSWPPVPTFMRAPRPEHATSSFLVTKVRLGRRIPPSSEAVKLRDRCAWPSWRKDCGDDCMLNLAPAFVRRDAERVPDFFDLAQRHGNRGVVEIAWERGFDNGLVPFDRDAHVAERSDRLKDPVHRLSDLRVID